jgi:RecB family exonuclease
VSTPRATRLVRVRDSRGMPGAIINLLAASEPLDVRDCLVVLPTRAAALHLRRAIEDRRLVDGGATVLPEFVTRASLVGVFARRLDEAPNQVSELSREVLLTVACRSAIAGGAAPPFRLRPGLVGSMMEFYDGLRRLGHSIDSFERLTVSSLEGAAEVDRGAERLLRQTRFLAAAYREFERVLTEEDLADEHGLRERIVAEPAFRPWRHVVVACRDIGASGLGLWPADFDLLTRVSGLTQIDVVVTEAALAGALHERLHRWMPGIEEVPSPSTEPADASARLLVPASPRGAESPESRVFLSRDREEELRDFARRVKEQARGQEALTLDRVALVVRRPLPYVYLARETLRSAGVPCQLHDALPLAAEPFAAALDLVAAAVGSMWSRPALLALLSSPVFIFVQRVDRRSLGIFDRALQEEGFLGGVESLASLAGRWGETRQRVELAAVARCALDVIEELLPLGTVQPPSVHLQGLREFLARHSRTEVGDDPGGRHARTRAAVLNGLATIGGAFARYDTHPVAFSEVDAVIKGWVEGHTFAPRTGNGGVQVTDAESAVFADLDYVQLAGVVEGEWPQRPPAGIFYSAGLLHQLGWPSHASRVAGDRGLFGDLLALPRVQIAVSAFRLEDDALVNLSPLVEAVGRLDVEHGPLTEPLRVCLDEALIGTAPHVPDGSPVRQGWLELRLARAGRVASSPSVRLRPYSVSALERYQDCAFKFFASEILRIEAPPEDQSVLTPRAQGTLMHEVLQRFFEDWDLTGHALTPSSVAEARRHLATIVDAALERLPPADAALERARFFGSPVAAGIVDVLLRLEAGRAEPVVGRLLEHKLDGEFHLGGGDRTVLLTGVVDRVDLLAGHRLRVVDYKSGTAPLPKRALQVPLYALFVAERLGERDGVPWAIEEASYVAFRGKRTVAQVIKPGAANRVSTLADVRTRTLEILDHVSAGEFPVRPRNLMMCRYCSYPSLCRKDYVSDE